MADDASRIRDYYNEFLLYLLHDRVSLSGRHGAIGELIDSIVPSGSAVLDLGCGIGISSQRLARRARTVVAVDLSPKLVEFARRSVPDVEFIVGDVTTIMLRRQFNVICMFDSLEHVPGHRRSALWSNLDRHLAPGGIVLVTAPHPSATEYEMASERDTLQIVDELLYPDVLLAEARREGLLPRDFHSYGVDRYPQYFSLVLERSTEPITRHWPPFAYLRDRLRTRLHAKRYLRVASDMLGDSVTPELIRQHRARSK